MVDQIDGSTIARSLGRRLKEVRALRGLTQEGLANTADLSVNVIQKIEGGRAARLDLTTYAALVRALAVKTGWFAPAEDDESPTLKNTKDEPAISANTDRREFMALLAGGPAAMFAAVETVRNGLVCSFSDRRLQNIDDWSEATWLYGQTYLSADPRALIVDLTVDINELHTEIRRETNTRRQREYYRCTALLSELMAMSLTKLGQLSSARRWATAAQHAADASMDSTARAYVRAKEAIAMLYTHRSPNHTLVLADEALAFDPTCGTAIAARAQALSVLRRDHEARQGLKPIESSLQNQHSMPSIDSIFVWHERQARHTESYVYSHIGDTEAARRAQKRAFGLYAERSELLSNRSQVTLVQLHEAMCMARQGHIDDASQAAIAALDALPIEHRSPFVQQMSRQFLEAIPASQQKRIAVVDFIDRLKSPSKRHYIS
ncbi:MAG: helix-turn-helix domain-containing protein [Myxococcota bacterium]